MKVLHVATDYPYIKDNKVSNYGGLGLCVSQLVGGLKDKGVEIDVLTRKDRGVGEFDELHEGVFRTWYFSPTKSRNWKLTHSFTMIPTLAKLLSKNNYDIVHMHNPPAAFITNGIAKRYGAKTVMTMHGPWAAVREKLIGLANGIEVYSMIKSDYITFDSDALMKRYGFSDRFFAIPNAVDYNKFRPILKKDCREFLELGSAPRTFLYSGRGVHGKDIHSIRRLAAKFGEYEFLIAGTKARMDDFAIGNLKYLGTVSNDDMPMVYNACDALILDTKAEGMSRAILEAMACGKAVIASNIPSNKEVLETDGFLFSDYEELESLVSGLSAKDLKDVGTGARERIKENFGIDSRIDKFINLYDNIVNNG